MPATIIQPQALAAPRGYSNGLLYPAGARMLFVAGQIGWNKEGVFPQGLEAQFDLALENILAVVREAGGDATSIGRLTVYVVDKRDYMLKTREIGRAYRTRMGKHFPAMALVQVSALLEDRALVEIEATAMIESSEGASP